MTAANSYLINKYCRRLSRELSAVIISVNYRLAPEHRYPSQVEDAFDVLKFVDENPNFEGFPTDVDLSRCFIMGDSAGGNLAHHIAVKACESEFTNLKFIGLVVLNPFLGGEERTKSELDLVGAPFISVEGSDWGWRSFLPEGCDRDHPAVNIFGPNSKDISGMKFPATMVVVGGFDPMKDWQKRYYEGVKRSGKEAYLVEYSNAFHGFYIMEKMEEAALCINEMRDFIRKQLASSSSSTG